MSEFTKNHVSSTGFPPVFPCFSYNSGFFRQSHILELPEEVLRIILSYVPDQLTVGQVCKDFYRVSCSLNAHRIEIRGEHEFDGGFSIYQSVLNSNRKVESLTFSNCDLKRTYFLRKIIENIGENIKTVEIRNVRMYMKVFSLLKLMPNLEKLRFFEFSIDIKNLQNFKLQLHKLKELEIETTFLENFLD